MKWSDSVIEIEEGQHLFMRRLGMYLLMIPARDLGAADRRTAAWTYGFARGLYFRHVELERDAAALRYSELKAKYPKLDEATGKAVRQWMDAPSPTMQVLPPRRVGEVEKI